MTERQQTALTDDEIMARALDPQAFDPDAWFHPSTGRHAVEMLDGARRERQEKALDKGRRIVSALRQAGRAVVDAAELKDLRTSVVAFGAIHATTWAREHGLPDGHLLAEHYDILARAGARMDVFTRVEAAA